MMKYVSFFFACYTFAMALLYTWRHLGHLDSVSFYFVWGLAVLWGIASLTLIVVDFIQNRPNQYKRNK